MYNIYLDSGYLNQKEISRIADKNGISFIIEIGARQVGKTYGCLKMMLDEDRRFILMRRTSTEAEFISNDINNPFTAYKDYDVSIKRDSKYSAGIYSNKEDSDPEYIGAVLALSTVAKIRGFNGSMYTDLVFDEFIPENHVMRIKDEGYAFANAILTIDGARQENGGRPLRVWLLANPNTIDNPILQTLNISTKIEDMLLKGQELSILPERGIMIILPKSEAIINKRRKNALFRAMGTDNRFSGMALDNEFSYNDSSDVKRVNLKDYKLIMILGAYGLYKHRSKDLLYCTPYIVGTVKQNRSFSDSEKDKTYVKREFPALRSYYLNNRMHFDTLTTKSIVLDFIL